MSTEIYLPQPPNSVVSPRPLVMHQNLGWVSSQLQESDGGMRGTYRYAISPWCASTSKRAFDLICVIPALIFLSPALALVAIAIRFTSPGPIVFRQQRAGQRRKLFTIYKFRTMVENSEAVGPGHTAKGDPRITPIGNFLRRLKLDELPQLYNVLYGDMSLVGPRPKLPHHDHTEMLCRPGVTGAATLAFRREQHILCEVPADRLEAFYQEHVIPRKIRLDADYMSRATFASDLGLLFATLLRAGSHLTHRDFCISSNRSNESKSPQGPIALQSN